MNNTQLEVFQFNQDCIKKIVWWKNPGYFLKNKIIKNFEAKAIEFVKKKKIKQYSFMHKETLEKMIEFNESSSCEFFLFFSGSFFCIGFLPLLISYNIKLFFSMNDQNALLALLAMFMIIHALLLMKYVFYYKKKKEKYIHKKIKEMMPHEKMLYRIELDTQYLQMNENLINEMVKNEILFKIENGQIVCLTQELFRHNAFNNLVYFLEANSIAYNIHHDNYIMTDDYYQKMIQYNNHFLNKHINLK